jgi:hypothetical protein
MYKIIFKVAGIIAVIAVIIIGIIMGIGYGNYQNSTTSNSLISQTVLAAEPQEIIQVETVEPITYKYNLTPDQSEMLARLVYLEGNTESLACQKGIVSVIINRLNSGYWGNTLRSVIYAKNQFTPAKRIPYVTPNSTNYEAVDHVLRYGVTLPTYVLYFRANHHHRWSGYRWYIQIDKTYFGYMAKDKKD